MDRTVSAQQHDNTRIHNRNRFNTAMPNAPPAHVGLQA